MNAVRMVWACQEAQQGSVAYPYEIGYSEENTWIGEAVFIADWGGSMPWVSIKEEIWTKPKGTHVTDAAPDVTNLSIDAYIC